MNCFLFGGAVHLAIGAVIYTVLYFQEETYRQRDKNLREGEISFNKWSWKAFLLWALLWLLIIMVMPETRTTFRREQ